MPFKRAHFSSLFLFFWSLPVTSLLADSLSVHYLYIFSGTFSPSLFKGTWVQVGTNCGGGDDDDHVTAVRETWWTWWSSLIGLCMASVSPLLDLSAHFSTEPLMKGDCALQSSSSCFFLAFFIFSFVYQRSLPKFVTTLTLHLLLFVNVCVCVCNDYEGEGWGQKKS